MLLYLVENSSPDIANAVGEMSKVLDTANMIKHIQNTSVLGLQIESIQGSKYNRNSFVLEIVIILVLLTGEEVSLGLLFVSMVYQ